MSFGVQVVLVVIVVLALSTKPVQTGVMASDANLARHEESLLINPHLNSERQGKPL
jgi:hypothetical protein